MAFDCAQVFYINSNLVAGAPEVGISSVDLFFKGVPNPTNNKSGIQYPGVTIAIVPTINGIPYIENLSMSPLARVGFTDVRVSTNASLPTNFRFPRPVQVKTNLSYAIVIAFDGDEDFSLWESVTGQTLIGSTTVSPGSSDRNVAGFYNYIGTIPIASVNSATTSNSGLVSGNTTMSGNTLTANVVYTLNNWTPLSYTQLKFNVYVARYAINGNTDLAAFVHSGSPPTAQIFGTSNDASSNISTGVWSFTIPSTRFEYVTYDRPTSSVLGMFVGERVYQNTVFWPGGTATPATVSVTANSDVISAVSNNINFNTFLAVGGATPEYVVFQSLNHLGANADVVNVRQVIQNISNTSIQVDEPCTFTNAACYFLRSPVAVVDQFISSVRMFGSEADMAILKDSTANSSVRFVNNSLMGVGIANGGLGYANTDYITFTGYEVVSGKVIGGYAATANVVTDGNGMITSVLMSNLGCGFVNTGNIVVTVSNSSGNNSTGNGISLTANVGAILKGEFLGQNGMGGYMTNAHLQVVQVGDFIPGVLLNNPGGTLYTASVRFPYYQVSDSSTFSGYAYYCDADGAWDVISITSKIIEHPWVFTKQRTLPSWSQELVTPYANGTSCNGAGGSTVANVVGLTSNSSVIMLNAVSNNDFTAVAVAPETTTMTFFRYVINNDYTGENTNYGNAWAKGVEVSFNLANGTFAEDLLVFSSMYRPPGVDVKMFARVYNSSDPDAFDDKDWTMLQLTGGINVFSSATDTSSLVELTWSFQPFPNTATPLSGAASATLNSNVITGVGTTWSTNATANLQPNTLVTIYPALFPNNYMVALVTAVTNDTSFTIESQVTNNDIVGSGLVIAPVLYPHQAFHNWLNDNVARYYNSSMVKFDGFDVCQFKAVMISSNGVVVPLLSDIRGVATSA